MNKVLVIVGDAVETVDTLSPYDRLQEGSLAPVVVGPERRAYSMALHEVRPGWKITKGNDAKARSLTAFLLSSEVNH